MSDNIKRSDDDYVIVFENEDKLHRIYDLYDKTFKSLKRFIIIPKKI